MNVPFRMRSTHTLRPRGSQAGSVSYARKGRRGLTLIPKLHVRYNAAGGIPRDCIDISKYGVTVRTDIQANSMAAHLKRSPTCGMPHGARVVTKRAGSRFVCR